MSQLANFLAECFLAFVGSSLFADDYLDAIAMLVLAVVMFLLQPLAGVFKGQWTALA